MEQKERKRDTVGRVTAVMDLLCSSEGTYSLRELQSRTGIPRSTLHRLLLALEREEWVYRDSASERFRPGIRFFLLNNRSLFYQELIHVAAPEMERLMQETGKTVLLSVLEGFAGLCIHSVEPRQAVKYVAHRGMTIPPYEGASGKVLLAFCPEERRRQILDAGLPEGCDRAALTTQLEEIRRQGYAYSREEWIRHAGDISVPLFDGRGRFVAQLGLAGLVTSFDGEEERLLQRLQRAAERMGTAL
ncbi:MAG: IclR family transcriptional regulator [Synergistales bacterium]|nr:IclR family transcriptional regulator [Synergistales bacterium]